MLKKIIANLLFLISLTIFATAQTSDADKKEKDEKLKADAVAFLRETSSEIMNLRTAENRIGFSSELAALMWFHDEKEARVMFNAVTNDFRQMLQQLDAQINAVKFDEDGSAMYSVPFLGGANKQAQMYRKFSKAMSVRQQIATALSEHDALLAYSFYTDTASAITNPKFRQQNEEMTSYFEMQLLQKIAEQNAAKGLEFGRKSLEKGVNNNHLELLQKIYAKDADAGAAFGEDVMRRLKSSSGAEAENMYILSSVLDLGAENRKVVKAKPTQKPIFSEQDLRDIAEMAARNLMNQTPEMMGSYSNIIDNIEEFSPSRAAQIRQKMKAAYASNSSSNIFPTNSSISSNVYVGNSAMSNSSSPPRVKVDTDAETLQNLAKLDVKKLSDEERAKALAEAGKMIEKIEDPNAKMMALSGLAIQIGKSGDKEMALQIMKQAESFVNQTPKNYVDYVQLWMLASGYAQVEPEKSFPVLETAVFGLNDTIAAFIKVGEFVDVNGEIIEDGEVQVSGFGGSGITREFTNVLSASDSTLKHLAEADFTRTRNLTNKFDRTEVRILAKMLILRAVLGDKTKPQTEIGMIEN